MIMIVIMIVIVIMIMIIGFVIMIMIVIMFMIMIIGYDWRHKKMSGLIKIMQRQIFWSSRAATPLSLPSAHATVGLDALH